MKHRKKHIVWIAICAVVFVVLVTFVGMRCSFFQNEASACLSVTLDKIAMQTVDKVVITTEDKTITITDQELIKKLVKETKVATNGPFGCYFGGTIDLYNGDQLVRSMKWSTCCPNTVQVYSSSFLHWCFSVEGIEEYGTVFLSDEVLAELNAYIAVE